VALALIALGGCTIVGMRQDIQARQARIDQKQQQLGELRANQSELAAESDRLKNDLQRRELNARDLSARLDDLIRLNEAAEASSAQQRAQQQQRRRRLQAISRQARAIDQSSNLTDEQKQRQLEALKDKTRQLLEILAAG
jgi:DNA repair exonuclease SbcCD ATPase subunit